MQVNNLEADIRILESKEQKALTIAPNGNHGSGMY